MKLLSLKTEYFLCFCNIRFVAPCPLKTMLIWMNRLNSMYICKEINKKSTQLTIMECPKIYKKKIHFNWSNFGVWKLFFVRNVMVIFSLCSLKNIYIYCLEKMEHTRLFWNNVKPTFLIILEHSVFYITLHIIIYRKTPCKHCQL